MFGVGVTEIVLFWALVLAVVLLVVRLAKR